MIPISLKKDNSFLSLLFQIFDFIVFQFANARLV